MPDTSELPTGQNIDAPRLVYDRVFAPDYEISHHIEIRQGVIENLNDAIARDPTAVLDDIAWLGAQQIGNGEPIPLRSFIDIRDEQEVDSWAAQRPYIGLIRDTLSITSNGSQFAFGETPQLSDIGWSIVFDKCKEISPEAIAFAQADVHYTQSMVRQAKRDEAENAGTDSEAKLAFWMQQHTLAKQQRALIRLRSLAVIARGPQQEVADEPLIVQQPNATSRLRGFGATVLKTAASLGMAW